MRFDICTLNTTRPFRPGETIYTENGHNFTQNTLRVLLDDAGFKIVEMWKDPLEWYALTLAGPQQAESTRGRKCRVLEIDFASGRKGVPFGFGERTAPQNRSKHGRETGADHDLIWRESG